MDNDDYEITVNIGNNKTKNKLMTFPKFDVKESLKVDSHHNNTLGIFHIIGKIKCLIKLIGNKMFITI